MERIVRLRIISCHYYVNNCRSSTVHKTREMTCQETTIGQDEVCLEQILVSAPRADSVQGDNVLDTLS